MITSTGNSRIRELVQLKKKGKERDRLGVFVAEGSKMYQEAPAGLLQSVYVSESYVRQKGMPSVPGGVPCETVSDPVFETISDTKTPQGILCVLRQLHYTEQDLLGKNFPVRSGTEGTAPEEHRQPLCMVLENLQDPGNLGTILRTAEGAGVTGVLLGHTCVDIYNPKVIRSTMGSIYRVPFCYTQDLRGVLKEWRQKGIHLYAAHLQGSERYDRENYTQASAFLIGNESQGLTEETAALADRYIRIPMQGKVESLNASVAAAILMYEAARQRS